MSPALSPWIILPLTLASMLIVSAHVTLTQASDAPASRKRLRVANGWIMLITLPLLAAGVSLIAPERDPRLFVLTWTVVVLLVTVSVVIAAADVANTLRLVRRDRQRHVARLLARRRERDARGEPRSGGR